MDENETKKCVETIIEELKKENISVSETDLLKIAKIVLNNYTIMCAESVMNVVKEKMKDMDPMMMLTDKDGKIDLMLMMMLISSKK